jgi:hypothetical protein
VPGEFSPNHSLPMNRQLDMSRGEARPHSGPRPRGEGETLPASWRSLALLVPWVNARILRGNPSPGERASVERPFSNAAATTPLGLEAICAVHPG